MKLRVIALSTALLFGTGMLAQTNATPANNTGNATATQPANDGNTANPNGGAAQTSTPETAPANYRPIRNAYGHSGGSWGWWGLVGLFGLFGLGGRGRRRDEVVRTGNSTIR